MVVRIHDPVVVELEREVSLLEDEVNQLNLERDVPRVTFNKKNMEFKKKQMELALARSNISRSAHGVEYFLSLLLPPTSPLPSLATESRSSLNM